MNLPYYKSEKSFQRFTKLIARAVNIYPAAFDHVPNVALETFNRDFRYAIKSAAEFGYTSPDINMARFAIIGQSIKCVMRNGYVLIGTEQGIKMFDEVKATQPSSIEPTATRFETEWNGKDVLGMLNIINNMKPRPIVILSISPEEAATISDIADVLFEPHPTQPGKWRIL
jgi:hypothetical protein